MSFADSQVDDVHDLSSDCNFVVPDILTSSCEDEACSPPLYMPPEYIAKLNNTDCEVPISRPELFQFPNLISCDELSFDAITETSACEESEYLDCCLPSIFKNSVCVADLKSCSEVPSSGEATSRQEIAPNFAQLGATNHTDHVSLLSSSSNFSSCAWKTLHQLPEYASSPGLSPIGFAEETSASRVDSDFSYPFENVQTSAKVGKKLDPLSEFQQCVALTLPTFIFDKQLEGIEGLISASCSTISSNNEALEDDSAYSGNAGRNSWYPVPSSEILPEFSNLDAGIPMVSFPTSVSVRNNCDGASLDGAASQFCHARTSNSDKGEGYVPMITNTGVAKLESSKGSSVRLRVDENCWNSRQQLENPMSWSNVKNSKVGAQQIGILGAARFSLSSPRSSKLLKSRKRAYVAPSHFPSNVDKRALGTHPCAKEMLYRAAAWRPIELSSEVLKKPKRRNVKISKDPQSVAARHRRERISERIRILQRLVPGGTKMDTASMLDEAVQYLKFLKMQVHAMNFVATGLYPPGVVGSMFSYYGGNSDLNQPATSSDALSCLRDGQSRCFNDEEQLSTS